MIATTWPAYFRARYGDKWPDYYLAFDTETSGFNMAEDVILELGHVLVEDGQVVDRKSFLVDWSEHAIVQEGWLRSKLAYTADQMKQSGKVFHHSWDRMVQEGVKPGKVFPFYMRFFADLMVNGCAFAGHNLSFDENMFLHNAVGFNYAKEFAFPEDRFWDTHAIEKANQMVGDPRTLPRPGESLRAYFVRVGRSFAKIKSSLDRHCFTKYKFAERGLDVAACHGAGTDAYMVHLLMEIFRGQATLHHAPGAVEAVPPPPPPTDGAFEPQDIPWGNYERRDPAQAVAGPVRYRGQRNN